MKILDAVRARKHAVRLAVGPGIALAVVGSFRPMLDVTRSRETVLLRTGPEPCARSVALLEDAAEAIAELYGGHVVTALMPLSA